MLRIAIPDGRLKDETLKRFKRAGLEISVEPRKYLGHCSDERINRVAFMRPAHIPLLVDLGHYDAGICGLDYFHEYGGSSKPMAPLNYNGFGPGNWKIALIGETSRSETSARDIPDHSEIFSEYPNLTSKFFRAFGKQIIVRGSSGATEAHVPYDFTFGVCVVSSGATLQANGLKVIDTLLDATTILIRNHTLKAARLAATKWLCRKLVESE